MRKDTYQYVVFLFLHNVHFTIKNKDVLCSDLLESQPLF